MVRGRSEAETRLEHRLECVIYGRWSSGNWDALIEVNHLATGPWALKEVHQFDTKGDVWTLPTARAVDEWHAELVEISLQTEGATIN